MKKDRSMWEILLDVLAVLQEENEAKKTRIMQKAYLDYRTFQRYFGFLLGRGFIVKCNPTPECYKLTEKGRILLTKLKDVDEVLSGKF